MTKEATATIADLYEGFTAEEIAEMQGVTGQAASISEKVPILKVNYCDIPDKKGNEIKKGNFVIGQNSSEVEVEVEEDGQKVTVLRVEDIGTDLGKTPKVTVLAFGFKYQYWPKDGDKKKICSSQLVFDRNMERAVGSTLGYDCASGKCPRRSKECDQKDKCSCQWVVFIEVPVGEEKVKAMMYVKGKSYMPFSDYIKSLGTTPAFFAPTKLTTKMERDGSVTYWIIGWEFQDKTPFPQIEIRQNMDVARATREAAEAFKRQQLQKAATLQIAKKDEGNSAKLLTNDDLEGIEFD